MKSWFQFMIGARPLAYKKPVGFLCKEISGDADFSLLKWDSFRSGPISERFKDIGLNVRNYIVSEEPTYQFMEAKKVLNNYILPYEANMAAEEAMAAKLSSPERFRKFIMEYAVFTSWKGVHDRRLTEETWVAAVQDFDQQYCLKFAMMELEHEDFINLEILRIKMSFMKDESQWTILNSVKKLHEQYLDTVLYCEQLHGKDFRTCPELNSI